MSRYVLFTGLLIIMLRLPGHAFWFDHDTLICLKVQAKFENVFDRDRKSCVVEVIKNGEIVDTVMVTWLRKKFIYLFECGNDYMLRVTKEGFVPMLVLIDTREKQDQKILHEFDFETRLITEKRAKSMDKELLNLPVAVINYDPEKRRYRYDKAYTESLKMRTVVKHRNW